MLEPTKDNAVTAEEAAKAPAKRTPAKAKKVTKRTNRVDELAPGLDPKGPHALDDPSLPPSNHPDDPTEVSDNETTDLGPKAHGPRTECPADSELRKEDPDFPVVKGVGTATGYVVEPADDGSLWVVAPKGKKDLPIGFYPDPRDEKAAWRMLLPASLAAQPGKVVEDPDGYGFTVALEDGTGLWVPFNEEVAGWRSEWTSGSEIKRLTRAAEKDMKHHPEGWVRPPEIQRLQELNPGIPVDDDKQAGKAP